MKKTTHALLASVLALGLLAIVHPAASAPQGGGRSAKIIHEYTLPSFSLEHFGYSSEELAIAQANGLTTTERPAIGSGLQQLNGNHYTTRVILDVNQELPAITDYKLEGLSILNANTVALSNDNDFGMLDPNSPSKVYRIRLSTPLR